MKRSAVVLPPESTTTIDFHIHIPPDAVPGDHVGAVVAAAVVGHTANGLAIQARAALTVDVRVLGTVHSKIRVDEPTVGKSGQTFAVTVHNDGNVLETFSGYVQVAAHRYRLGPSGMYIIPGGTGTFTAVWADKPFIGPVTATAHVTASIDNRPAGIYTSPSLRFWVIPWLAISGGLAVIALVITGWWSTRSARRRRRIRRHEEREVLREFRARRSSEG